MENHVNAVDDQLIGGLSYKLKAGASYVSDKRKCTFYASGGNQYSSSGVKIHKFNSVSDQWLDPSTFRLMLTLNNSNTDADVIKHLHWNPAVLFRRCRVSCGGVVIEDIDDYNRLSSMLTALKPVDEQRILLCKVSVFSIGLMILLICRRPIGILDEMIPNMPTKGNRIASDWDEASAVKKQRTVLFKPMLGILDRDKLIPLRYAPLQFEFELVSNSADCVYVGPIKNDICNANWGISNIQCKMDLLTLDSSPQDEYASHLLSGKSLPINFSSYTHSSQSTNGDKDFSAHIHRSLRN